MSEKIMLEWNLKASRKTKFFYTLRTVIALFIFLMVFLAIYLLLAPVLGDFSFEELTQIFFSLLFLLSSICIMVMCLAGIIALMSKKEYHFKITENGIFCTNGGIREKDIFIEWKNIKGFFVAPTPSQFGGVLPLIKPLESIFGTGKEKRKKEIGTPINLLNQPMKQIKYSQLAGKLVGMVRTTPEVHEKVIQILNEKTKKGSPQNKKYSVI